MIESALYLYYTLLDNQSVVRPKCDLYQIQQPGVIGDGDENESETSCRAHYEGGMMISFLNSPIAIRHEISPIGKG